MADSFYKINRGISMSPQPGAPSNPSNGDIYYDTSLNKFRKYENGAWSDLGSGSGSGVLNFITNGNAESGTTGWVTYNDGTGTTPVDGTGGVVGGTTTVTTTTSSPLSGAASFLFQYSGGLVGPDSPGSGYSYDFTIDNANLAKVLKISFDYLPTSTTWLAGVYPNTNSLLTVWIYDITNARLIQPSGHILTSNSTTIPAHHECTFQTAHNSTSYRIIFHQATTRDFGVISGTVKIDNISVSPSEYVYGSPVTDWVAYTPAFTGFGTPTGVSFFSRRNGSNLEVVGGFTTGTNTAVGASISIGHGGVSGNVSIDATKQPAGGVVGRGGTNAAASTTYFGNLTVIATSGTSVQLGYRSSTAVETTSANGNAIAGSGAYISVNFSVPIQGWSSNVQMSDSASTRVVAASYSRNTSQSISNNTSTVILFSNQIEDTTGSYNPATGVYTVYVPGDYKVSALVEFASNGTGSREILATQSGSVSLVQTLDYVPTGFAGGATFLSGDALFKCQAGDTITISTIQVSGGALNVAPSGGRYTHMSIEKLSGPSAIAATETVACSYFKSGAQSMVNGVTTVLYDTKVEDTHGSYNPATGVWTCTSPGWYDFKAGLSITVPSTSVSVFFGIRFNFVGSVTTARDIIVTAQSTSGNTFVPNGTTDMPLRAGDTVQIQFFNGNATQNCDTAPGRNFMSITKRGSR